MAKSADGLPKEQLAAQITEYNKPYSLNTIPVPTELDPYELLLRTAVASYCHTDSMAIQGLLPFQDKNKPPGIAGSHEPTGTVVGLGSAAAKDGKFKVGDRVAAICTSGPCGECDDCKGPESQRHYCTRMKGYIGLQLPGAFEEYVVVDSRFSAIIPDNLSFASAAPLTCAGATAWRAVVVAERGLKPGDWIGIIGSGGGLGHLAIQFAVKKGYKVVGIDARKVGLELSKKTGAECVVDATIGAENIVAEVEKATGPGLCATAIVLSEHESAIGTACSIVGMHRTVVQIAQPKSVNIPFHHFIFRDIRVVGSLLSSGEQFNDMMKFIGDHEIEVETQQYDGLKSIPQVFEDAHSGKYAGKLVVIVDKEAVKEDKEKKRL